MNRETKRALICPVVKAAMLAAETMPPAERADVYSGIAHIAKKTAPEIADRASAYATALRDAQQLQLHFEEFARL